MWIQGEADGCRMDCIFFLFSVKLGNLNQLYSLGTAYEFWNLFCCNLFWNLSLWFPVQQVDAALDLSHTQNIGRMIKAHFPHSQVCFFLTIACLISRSESFIKYCLLSISITRFSLLLFIIIFDSTHYNQSFWLTDSCFLSCSLLLFLLKRECSTMPMCYFEPSLSMEFPLLQERLLRDRNSSVMLINVAVEVCS